MVEAFDLSALLYRHNMLALVRLIAWHLSKAFKFPENTWHLNKKFRKKIVTCMSTLKKKKDI